MGKIQRGARLLKEDICHLRYALLGLAIYCVLVHILFGQFCPVVILFHIPCPGCGMTRALFLVLSGRWMEAWSLQPLIFGWMGLGIWFGVGRYLLDRRFRTWKGCLILLLIATVGLYLWRLVHGFPVALRP